MHGHHTEALDAPADRIMEKGACDDLWWISWMSLPTTNPTNGVRLRSAAPPTSTVTQPTYYTAHSYNIFCHSPKRHQQIVFFHLGTGKISVSYHHQHTSIWGCWHELCYFCFSNFLLLKVLAITSYYSFPGILKSCIVLLHLEIFVAIGNTNHRGNTNHIEVFRVLVIIINFI